MRSFADGGEGKVVASSKNLPLRCGFGGKYALKFLPVAGDAEELEAVGEEVGLQQGHGHPAFAGGVQAVLRYAAAEETIIAGQTVPRGAAEVLGHVGESDFAVAAGTGVGAVQERSEALGHRALRTGHVRDGDAGHVRRVEGARVCLVGEVVAGHRGVVAGVTNDGDLVQLRKLGVELLPAEAEAFERGGPVGGQQQVGLGEEVAQFGGAVL